MEIKGKVHCLFEQSGTFKNEFKKLGIPAEDYDIQNNFRETDHVIDLFAEIDRAYDNLTARQQDSKTARQQDSKTRYSTQSTHVKTLLWRSFHVFISAKKVK